ncbi:glycine zipper domain-containing protein [Methylophaga sp. OBS4]|uniref:glycine zipper domain-containing protein n=1 Tax=Methylophaga sp. OBS4 TaxID=2991935 RepID=UPI00225BA191|nr:glycine zipper domain-containing protein [Methylophaga sp. OBS4]MCX4186233.1 hypothetical protein [Methylophaga sp. OBS4]
MKMHYLFLAAALLAVEANADSSTLDAAIGGGIGGAVGAAVGNEVAGRDGAIVGGALGGAVGAAVTTDDHHDHDSGPRRVNGYHCPPGQAKKGNC